MNDVRLEGGKTGFHPPITLGFVCDFVVLYFFGLDSVSVVPARGAAERGHSRGRFRIAGIEVLGGNNCIPSAHVDQRTVDARVGDGGRG